MTLSKRKRRILLQDLGGPGFLFCLGFLLGLRDVGAGIRLRLRGRLHVCGGSFLTLLLLPDDGDVVTYIRRTRSSSIRGGGGSPVPIPIFGGGGRVRLRLRDRLLRLLFFWFEY